MTCVYLLIYLFIHPSISIYQVFQCIDRTERPNCVAMKILTWRRSSHEATWHGLTAWTPAPMDGYRISRVFSAGVIMMSPWIMFHFNTWNKNIYNNELLLAQNFRTINRINFQHLGDVFWPFVTMLAPTGSARATKGWRFSIFQNSHFLLVQFMAILYHTIPRSQPTKSGKCGNHPMVTGMCLLTFMLRHVHPQSGQWFWKDGASTASSSRIRNAIISWKTRFIFLITCHQTTPNPKKSYLKFNLLLYKMF